MYLHANLGSSAFARARRLFVLISDAEVALGGYTRHKIYGTLNCKSGKRIKTDNRIFFKNEQEAIKAGYRPCAHCLPQKYRQWQADFLANNRQ